MLIIVDHNLKILQVQYTPSEIVKITLWIISFLHDICCSIFLNDSTYNSNIHNCYAIIGKILLLFEGDYIRGIVLENLFKTDQ